MNATPLESRIRALIRANGPMSVAEYMTLCLADPQDGYYMRGDPFGRGGDFITAPDVSQMFGELIGLWCLQTWLDAGCPQTVRLVEAGPGRGTLMADLLRVTSVQPKFLEALSVHLVETSPRLREAQKTALTGAPCPLAWHDRIDDVPDGPMILLANEFFDALPIRQYVRAAGAWRERMVGLDPASDQLAFGIGPGRLADDDLPERLRTVAEGTVLETQPLANAIAATIGERLAASGGAALIIDYGYVSTAPGDTLQAVRKHQFADVLAHCGEADLTAHVNFEALARAARQSGAQAHGPMTQGDFLIKMGLLERAGALGAGKEPSVQEQLSADVERLAGADHMGNLFKVLALSAPGSDLGQTLKPFDSTPARPHHLARAT